MGDRFLLLKRGKSLGDYAKADITLQELTRLMAGGAELEQLAHELERGGPGDGATAELGKELLEDTKTLG